MAKIIFPRKEKNPNYEQEIKFSGNLLWGTNNLQPKGKVLNACYQLRNKGYWASPFPEGDGITFSNNALSNKEIFKDIVEAFYWMEVNPEDSQENRKLILELGETPVPKPGNFYYKTCKLNFFTENGNEFVSIIGKDVFSGEIHSVTISKSQYDLIEEGTPFQIALRSIPKNDREFLISGLSLNDIFKEDEPDQYN